MEIQQKISNASNNIIKAAAFVGAAIAIASGYTFLLNYVWKPKVSVSSSDLVNGTAKISYKNILGRTTNLDISGDDIFILDGGWGVKLGRGIDNNGKESFTKIFLVKNGMVYETV